MKPIRTTLDSPKLVGIIYYCYRRGDGLDHDSEILFKIYDKGSGTIYAQDTYKGGDGSGSVTKSIALLADLSKDQINGKFSYLEIKPKGNDKWEFDCVVEFQFNDGTHSTFNMSRVKLGNHQGWGHFWELPIANV